MAYYEQNGKRIYLSDYLNQAQPIKTFDQNIASLKNNNNKNSKKPQRQVLAPIPQPIQTIAQPIPQTLAFQPAPIQTPIYAQTYAQPVQFVTQPNVLIQTIPEEVETEYVLRPESSQNTNNNHHHNSVLAEECKCEFCFNLKCDCHSCNPRRYCKCFFCERLHDQDKKMIIKKDFMPSEQIQRDLPMTKQYDRFDSSMQITPRKSSNKSWYMN